MIAVDTNLLVYAHRADAQQHVKAKAAIESLRTRPGHWAVPWPCVHEFVAVVTHPKIFSNPTPLAQAFSAVESWDGLGNLLFLAEDEKAGYLQKLKQIALAGKISGPRIHDARVAAICLQHGVSELWTCDRDFSAFPGLTARNPL